jgi:hypothetical protein
MNPIGLAVVGGALWWLSRVNRNPTGAGYRDKSGKFHPIRNSKWYQPSLLDEPETKARTPRSVVATAPRPARPARLPVTAQVNYQTYIDRVINARNDLREVEDSNRQQWEAYSALERERDKLGEEQARLRAEQSNQDKDFQDGLYALWDSLHYMTSPTVQALGASLRDTAYLSTPTRIPTPYTRARDAAPFIEMLRRLPDQLNRIILPGDPDKAKVSIAVAVAKKKLKQLRAWDATNAKLVAVAEAYDKYSPELARFDSRGLQRTLDEARDRYTAAQEEAAANGVRELEPGRFVLPDDKEGLAEIAKLEERNRRQHEEWEKHKRDEASRKFQREMQNAMRWESAVRRAEERVTETIDYLLSKDKWPAAQHRKAVAQVDIAKAVLARLKQMAPESYLG